MKKNIILIFAIICFPSLLLAQNLTVATYNIRNSNVGDENRGNGWGQRCPVITKLIRFHGFDIFGSQEVLNRQLNDMLSQLPGYGYIGVGREDGAKKGEFAPVFYKKEKLSLISSGNFWLSETSDKPSVGWDAALPRICTWGKFQIKENGLKFWFFNLHMDHIGVKARLESSKLVLAKIKEMCGSEPFILTGDFNEDQNTDGYKLISNSGICKDSYEIAGICYAQNGTFNSFDPSLKTDQRIDHVFVSKNFSVERYGVLTDSYWAEKKEEAKDSQPVSASQEKALPHYIQRLPSDHFPVKVVLTFTH